MRQQSGNQRVTVAVRWAQQGAVATTTAEDACGRLPCACPRNWRNACAALRATFASVWCGRRQSRGQRLLEIPADMVHQPVDFGRQLHIAPRCGWYSLSPSQRNAGQRQRRGFQTCSCRSGAAPSGARLNRPAGCHQQGHGIERHCTRAHAASLAHQAVYGFFLLHQHMVEKRTMRCCTRAPATAAAAGFTCQAVNETIQNEKGTVLP